MFDVFYFGNKPDLFAFEKPAINLNHAAELSRTKFFWFIYGDNDYSKFDFEWRPAPWENTHIHVFPSQWQRDGGVYLANKDTVRNKEWHWRNEMSVVRKPNKENWILPQIHIKDVDFSWHPDPHEPPYIYHFPSQHQSSCGLLYKVPNATNIKFSSAFRVTTLPDKTNWTIPEDIDEKTVDFSWHPNSLDAPYIYHFSSDWHPTTGLIYTVPTATEIKIIDEIPTTGNDKPFKWLDMFYIDKGNSNSGVRFAELLDRYPTIQKVRYANSMMDTIARCCNRSYSNRFWVISSECNYNNFDFTWHPENWQGYMTHVFPSQWNKWSDTFMINRREFETHSKWAKSLQEFPNLNFVSDQVVKAEGDGDAIFYIDFGNNDASYRPNLLKRFPKLKVTRYANSYFDTLKRIVSTATTEYIWVISSICEYDHFDFSWQPEPWQSEMIHVFPSENQKRGDTFYINVESFKSQMYELEMLDWFNVINYCRDQGVTRQRCPIIKYKGDTLVTPVKETDFNFPYAIFAPEEHEYYYSLFLDYPCLWSPKDKKIDRLSFNGGVSVVPKEARSHINTQIYDYSYTDKDSKDLYLSDKNLDIVYISNGEPDAERWYDHLLVTMNHKVPTDRLHRVQNVNGRIAAYHAAARASTTPWFFAVFAKLEVTGNFNWNWQPDYWQEPKHYIFHSRNCLNGLEYGHMGVIAYNKQLVLDTIESGLDFTLSQPHQVVPELSAIAYFNADPWMTWRTAFREVVKLKHFMSTAPTLETEHRLDTWLTVADGDNAKWCLRGAADAIEYYNEVSGDYDKLMLSFDWPWLKDRFRKYNI